MIKVANKDGNTDFFESIVYVNEGKIKFAYEETIFNIVNYRTVWFMLDTIEKVEKQVKDLTLEEMIKLGFYKSEYTPNIKNYVVFELNKKTHLQHNLTDYIDITSIVKGE